MICYMRIPGSFENLRMDMRLLTSLTALVVCLGCGWPSRWAYILSRIATNSEFSASFHHGVRHTFIHTSPFTFFILCMLSVYLFLSFNRQKKKKQHVSPVCTYLITTSPLLTFQHVNTQTSEITTCHSNSMLRCRCLYTSMATCQFACVMQPCPQMVTFWSPFKERMIADNPLRYLYIPIIVYNI